MGEFSGALLAFGEGDPKGRIKNLARWKKPAFWVLALAVIVCIGLAVCLLTNPGVRYDELKFVNQESVGNFHSFDYELDLGRQVKSGIVWAESWYDGECVQSAPVILNEDVKNLHILIMMNRGEEVQPGMNIQIDTDEESGSLLTFFPFPEDKTFVGWAYGAYEEGETFQITPGEERCLVSYTFDTGSGIRAIDREELLKDPERLQTGYQIVIRAVFSDTEMAAQNEGFVSDTEMDAQSEEISSAEPAETVLPEGKRSREGYRHLD